MIASLRVCIFACLIVGLLADSSIARAEIETCSGCKLNRFPDVKQFVVDEDSGALSFDSVTRKIIPGHNPDLVFYDAGSKVVERIDMTLFSFLDLVELLHAKGFHKKYPEL